ncbi:hypothetical protein C1646_679838 [Rhizophagus diaphanus]|nr:hypothetical protein C1646_679838 [Rhizophagus diaphanus] [Rhizophagus sp. MUCL 43196]
MPKNRHLAYPLLPCIIGRKNDYLPPELCEISFRLNVYNGHLAHITFHDSKFDCYSFNLHKKSRNSTTSDDVDVYKGCISCDADSFLYYNSFFLYKLYVIPYDHETATDERSGRNILR